jgi:hypothetical protein
MKYYDNRDNFHERTHTIRVTLQSGEYKGHIAYKVGGNCFGSTFLEWNPECDTQEDINGYVENDCNFRVDEECDIFLFTLTNEKGDKCDFECDERELEENVVAIEIIDCIVDDKDEKQSEEGTV